MIVRQVQETDLIELSRWFETRKWPYPAIANAGPSIGMLALNGETPLACVWVNVSDSSLAQVDWTGTNPDVPTDESGEALMTLLEHLKAWATQDDSGVNALVLYTRNAKLSHFMKHRGFKHEEGFSRLLWIKKD